MEKNKALIIDKETDFCILMGHYLSRKDIDTYYTDTIDEGLEIIECKRPDIIIADKNFPGVKNSLHFIIDATNDYDPNVFLIDSRSPRKDGIRMDLIDEIIKGIKDKFW